MEITGYSISEYIDHINKSGCGYVPSSTFRFRSLGKGIDELNPEENVSPRLIGSAVDCMTHFMSGSPAMLAFGNKPFVARHIGGKSLEFKALDLIKTGITGLDDQSIINAVKLSGFDTRFILGTESYQPIEKINPDGATIQNVRTMVKRSLHVFEVYGPKLLDIYNPRLDEVYWIRVCSRGCDC